MIKVLVLVFLVLLIINPASAEKDCLDYSIESGEPVVLIGIHPLFYGPTSVNHFMNYEIIDSDTIRFTNHSCNSTWIASMNSWDEIRPGVYSDGFKYFKLFIYREPQRYWRRMI